jgi:hypothetical protein
MNPQSYQAKNDTETRILNILRTSINQERAINISQQCSNVASSGQTNSINNLKCAICNGGVIFDDNGKMAGILPAENIRVMTGGKPASEFCKMSNITQENKAESQQKCTMNAILTDVMKAQADSQSQAVVKALQEASGLLSSNSSKAFSCTDIKTDLTQKDYFGYVGGCANTFTSNQNNEIKFCGPMNDVIQRNTMSNISECINSNVTTKEMGGAASSGSSTQIETSQKAEGLDLFASLGSIASMSPIMSIIFSVAIFGVLFLLIMLMNMSN